MTHSRRHALAAPLLALSVALLASVGSAGAQSTPPPRSANATADKPTTADADKAARDEAAAKAEAEAERKAEARKPRRDAKADRKPPEREIEEEETP